MIVIITQIKKKIYDTLTTDLGYYVVDNLFEDKVNDMESPCVILTLNNVVRESYRNIFYHKVKFKIDIFSDYDGEAEILKMESDIFKKSKQFYDLDYVTFVKESDFRILDDKSTGTVKKHGIIIYTFLVSGEEEEDNDTTSNQGD